MGTIVCKDALRRSIAFTFDMILLLGIQLYFSLKMLEIPEGVDIDSLMSTYTPDPMKENLMLILIDLVCLLNFVLLPVIFGGSIGKLILNMKIVGEKGKYLSFVGSIIRSLPVILLVISNHLSFYDDDHILSSYNYLFLIYIIWSFAMILKSEENRSVLDSIMGAYVIGRKEALILD